MTEIAAALVKELRDMTGAGMMDSKRALQETNGDLEAAQKLLRERGMASAAKRAGRETPEGKVGYRVEDDRKRGVIVAVGCETEPVSNNDEFLAFATVMLESWIHGCSSSTPPGYAPKKRLFSIPSTIFSRACSGLPSSSSRRRGRAPSSSSRRNGSRFPGSSARTSSSPALPASRP